MLARPNWRPHHCVYSTLSISRRCSQEIHTAPGGAVRRRGGKMRCVVKFVASAALALLAAACDPYLGAQYLREGIGPNLATPEAVNIAELQNAYLELLCVQASPSLAPGVDPACNQARLGPAEW